MFSLVLSGVGSRAVGSPVSRISARPRRLLLHRALGEDVARATSGCDRASGDCNLRTLRVSSQTGTQAAATTAFQNPRLRVSTSRGFALSSLLNLAGERNRNKKLVADFGAW